MRVRLADGAKRDFNEGLRWYRKRSNQAADRFIEFTDSTIARILKAPARYRPLRPNVRVIRCKDFPYRLIYQIIAGSLVIIAIAHDKRLPDYWHRRIE